MVLFCADRNPHRDLTSETRSRIASSWQALATRAGAFARQATGRTAAAFKILHGAIVTAKTRRLERELTFHTCSHDPAKFPQLPLILDEKWDL